MSFNSFSFWLVFPVIFGIYWLIPTRLKTAKQIWLLFVSYLLYMNWRPTFALILLYVTLITYFGALSFNRVKSRKKVLGWVFSLLSIAPLILFKYYNFLNETLTTGLEVLGLHFTLPGLNWAVPVGLSFFTFQAVGYLLEVFRGQFEAEKGFLDYALFVSFFPQIASGPISRASELLPQIKNPQEFSYEQGKQGLKLLLWGMFIKVVIADRLGLFVDTVYDNYLNYNGTTLFVASLFYSIQIYCDFAGYSLMAIGIAKGLGFDLINNFCRPYFAISISDFWKRWHISLTRWLTHNIYIPLGGNRCSKFRCYINIMVTFLVSGLWHGAAWTFVLWGCIHGVVQIIEKHFRLSKYEGTCFSIRLIRIIITFLIVNFAWVFFRSPDISTAFAYLGKVFTDFGRPAINDMGGANLMVLAISFSILVFKELREACFSDTLAFWETRFSRWMFYVSLFCMILLFGVLDGGQFIYVSF